LLDKAPCSTIAFGDAVIVKEGTPTLGGRGPGGSSASRSDVLRTERHYADLPTASHAIATILCQLQNGK
jgi:hypothetical protein